jgi:hypothetical protein
MKNNTTYNNFLLINVIKDFILKISFMKYNVTQSIIAKFVLSLFIFLNISICSAQSNSNKSELMVESNRNDRSTPSGGTYYKMVLSNSGNSEIFDLSSSSENERGTNPDGSTTARNVKLVVTFVDANLKKISQIKANAGETVKFFAHIEVPNGTPEDSWSINKVTATAQSNKNYKLNTVLNTKVISTDN